MFQSGFKSIFISILSFTLVFCDSKIQNSSSTRIVNGEITQISKHPYVVAIHRRSCKSCEYEHFCGGTIYNENTIITAANCVRNAAPHDLLIVAGSSFRTGFLKDGGMIFPVADFITHQDETIDLAIVRLALKISLGSSLSTQAVSIATTNPTAGDLAVIVGWGRIKDDSEYSEELRETLVPTFGLEQCQSSNEFEICAGSVACEGDAGGPLMLNGHMIGVIAWNIECSRPDKPVVYTNIVKLNNWIVSHVLGVHTAFL